jgi:C4-dicarboxylate-specific signal transduction histidine kinase
MHDWDLSSLLDMTPILCFVIDADEKLRVVSGGLAQRLQIDPREALGRSPFSFPHFPIKRNHFRKALNGSFAVSQGVQGASYETQLSPAKHGAVMGLTTDMTKHMVLEQYLDEERHKLLVSQRLTSLAGIANGLAHEINNPLAIIAGYAEVINNFQCRGKLTNEQLLHAMEKITEASQRCHRIIESIKTFARDGSKDPIEIIDLNDLVKGAVDLCSQRIVSGGIRLRVDSAGPAVTLEGRRLQLLQSLFNLLQNACDAAVQTSGPSVQIVCHENGERIRIDVIDNGPGVPDSIRNRVFEPFFTTKGETRNVGVGLSSTKGILEEHHGFVEFTSEAGQTRFSIDLPRFHRY